MKFLYLSIALIVIFVNYVSAQDGELDKNFGNNGTAVFHLYENSSAINSIAKIGDKIYAAGYTHPDDRDKFSIVRFTADGDLDTQFGEEGILILPLGAGYSTSENILLQPDGKLVASGWVREGNKDLYVVVRIHQDGSLDNTFGEGGIAKGSYSSSTYAEDEIYATKLLSDGRLIIAGKSYNGQNNDVFIGCLDGNGDPCTNFGEEGFHIIEFLDGNHPDEVASALAVDGDDNIYLGGSYTVDLFDDNSMFVKKLNSLGVIENTFGVDGNIILHSPEGYINVMTIDNEGRLLIAGTAEIPDSGDRDFFLARYSSEGEPDGDFGDNGIVKLDNGDDETIEDVHILPNGDIIAAGTFNFPSRFLLTRLKDNGDQDLTFGDEGWTSTLILSTFNGIEDIHINDDGSILAGGHAYTSSEYRMALAQYTNTITSVDAPLIPANNIAVFPNPASSVSKLSFSTDQPVRFSARMTDMEGRNLPFRLVERKLQAGDHSFEISLKQITAGNYLLIMNFDGVDVVKQIVIVPRGT